MQLLPYNDFMAEVDKILESRIGMSHMDLPDTASHSMYEDGSSPEEVARDIAVCACDNMGFDFDEIWGDM